MTRFPNHWWASSCVMTEHTRCRCWLDACACSPRATTKEDRRRRGQGELEKRRGARRGGERAISGSVPWGVIAQAVDPGDYAGPRAPNPTKLKQRGRLHAWILRGNGQTEASFSRRIASELARIRLKVLLLKWSSSGPVDVEGKVGVAHSVHTVRYGTVHPSRENTRL